MACLRICRDLTSKLEPETRDLDSMFSVLWWVLSGWEIEERLASSPKAHRKSRAEAGSLENLGFTSWSQPSAVLSPLRYEEEVVLRATAENEFVVLKKVSDYFHMSSS